MWIHKNARRLISVAVFVVGISLALSHIDRSTAISAFFAFSAAQIILITIILLLGTILAGLRLFYIAVDSGQQLTLGEALIAFAVGQIGSLVGIQIFGQIAARSLYLKQRGISTSENIIMIGYERFIACMVSAIFAAFGTIYLFGHTAVEPTAADVNLIQPILGIAAAAIGASVLGWGRRAVNFLWGIHRLDAMSILRIVGLTVLIHATTASAFCIATLSITPEISLAPLIAACGIIMFASSLPISFSGWGVREVSAVFVFQTIGVPAANALIVAVMVGVLSLLSIVVFALAGPVITPRKRLPVIKTRDGSSTATAIMAVLPLAIVTLIIVQIHAQTANGYVNLNPADPLAVLAAIIFLPRVFASRFTVPLSRHFLAALTACGIAIFIGVFIGAYRFGWTQWAYLNRGMGYVVLVAYIFSGALVGTHPDKSLRLTCLRAFIGGVVAVGAFDLIRFCVSLCNCTVWHAAPGGLQGLSHDRNAFAFLLCLTLAALPMLDSARLRSMLLVTLAVFVFLTGSRAGWITSIMLVSVLLYFRTIRWRDLGLTTVFIGMSYMGISYFGQIDLGNAIQVDIAYGESSHLHIQSVLGGFRMFVAHPFFGAGVGAYYLQQKGQLLIHSSPVWILAETGLFGFLAFGSLGFVVFKAATTLVDYERHCFMLFVLAFGMMSLPHDMLYQRAIWFLMSLLLFGGSTSHTGLSLTAIPATDRAQSIGRFQGADGQAPSRGP